MTTGDGSPPPRSLAELRELDGPNLYFTRPAIKVTLAVPAWLEASAERLSLLAQAAGLAGVGTERGPRVGPPGTEQRRRFVVRLAAHLTRTLAYEAGIELAVRSRPGIERDQVVVAFPWRRLNAARALGTELAGLFDLLPGRRSLRKALKDASTRLRRTEPGPAPQLPEPAVPVIMVTGTNGKTTTVRLLAHLVRSAGRSPAYSSTDGVYRDDEELIRSGDYSGFGGAGLVISQPGIDVAVLEVARGGVLLRGIGAAHNDVAVVTNVSADHLGLQGIDTLDQLAEVKATILRVTRRRGWDVLNADDPRVLAMRRVSRGRPWMVSLDPDHPALRSALGAGGRGMTVIDGAMTMLVPGQDPHRLIALEIVPVTLAGISSHNISNAMQAAAAALAIGLPEAAVVKGLRTFVLDAERNPGRINLFEVDGRIVVIDYAHNEAGLMGLVEACRKLRPPGREIWLGVASAGDRTTEIRHGMAYIGARGADHVAVIELLKYLRGNSREVVVEDLRAGFIDGGAGPDVPVHVDELTAMKAMLAASGRGDVVAATVLAQRAELFALMAEVGGRPVGPARLRRLVRRARGA